MPEVSDDLRRAYDEQYTSDLRAWRETGGRFKAENICRVCADRQFNHVLECGAGEGSILKWLDQMARFEHLYAIEISSSGMERIRERGLRRLVEVKGFDGYHIPYESGRFDLACCSHVIEHVEHPRLLIRELARTSAMQVFEIPLDYSPRVDQHVQHFVGYGHINIFTPATFRFLLRSEGFQILSEHLAHTASAVYRFKRRSAGPLKQFSDELRWRTLWLRRFAKWVLLGPTRYKEFAYSTYTCLTRREGI